MKKLVMAAAIACAPLAVWAEGVMHKVAVHVNSNDMHVVNMALNNVENVAAFYKSQGDDVTIEVVAYGPGLQILLPGKSPVEERIKTMSLAHEHLEFAACGNTLRKMSEKAGKELTVMEEASVVPSGVVRLIELQEQGYAYVRP
ncbi:DsrE family protein [Thalassovita sp.]|uniref:DsrE family protein n=1 Tax=Thalassovita sp. TaxID=1979401 RepID=UPI0029DE7E1E|nr:DsrE family protein [Thalassovita sp.]